MSTSYYRFKKPITKVSIETVGSHDHVTVWVNHQNAGTLTVDAGDGGEFLWMFDSEIEVLHRHAGNLILQHHGLVYTKKVDDLSDDEFVLSERGEVCQVKDLLSGLYK